MKNWSPFVSIAASSFSLWEAIVGHQCGHLLRNKSWFKSPLEWPLLISTRVSHAKSPSEVDGRDNFTVTVRDWRWGTKAPFWELVIHLECSDSLCLVWDWLLRKTNTAIFYHVHRITALAYTKHYSLQLIPLTLKTQARTYSEEMLKRLLCERIMATVQMLNIS